MPALCLLQFLTGRVALNGSNTDSTQPSCVHIYDYSGLWGRHVSQDVQMVAVGHFQSSAATAEVWTSAAPRHNIPTAPWRQPDSEQHPPTTSQASRGAAAVLTTSSCTVKDWPFTHHGKCHITSPFWSSFPDLAAYYKWAGLIKQRASPLRKKKFKIRIITFDHFWALMLLMSNCIL